MKKMKLTYLLAITFPFLVGCGEKPADGEPAQQQEETKAVTCKEVWDHALLLLNSANGKDMEAVSTVRESPDFSAYLALNSLKYKDEDYQVTWEALPEGKWKSAPQTGDYEAYTKYTPLYGDEKFQCSLKATIKKGDDSYSGEWKFNAGIHKREDLTDYTYMSIQEMNEKFVNASTKTDVVGKKIYTYGKITATVEQSSQHIYSGFWIQDGAHGLMCYQVYESAWFALEPKVGDTVIVGGTVADYSGLMEIYVYSLEGQKKTGFFDFPRVDDEKAAAVVAPVVTSLDNYAWNKDDATTRMKISALVEMNDLLYVEGLENLKVGVAATLKCKKGDSNVNVTINYHIGKAAYEALIEATKDFKANETRFKFYGVLSANNDINLNPIFGKDSFIVNQ